MFIEILKFIIFSLLIVLISKYILVKFLRKLAQALNLSSKTVGNVAGIATSIPEFLTVTFSAFAGLSSTSIYNIISSNIINLSRFCSGSICHSTSIYNIISSNIINLVQYSLSIILSKNQKQLSNKAIKIQLVLVIITILIPIFMLISKIEFSISFVPIFILLFLLFYYINSNIHKLYLKKQDKELYKQIEKEKKWVKGKVNVIIKYSIGLIFTSIVLYFIGDKLSIVLENLAQIFNIPEAIIGIALGFITSIPELITFFESQRHYKNNKEQEGVVEATNNLLTSNVLNLFVIQTIGIIIINLV